MTKIQRVKTISDYHRLRHLPTPEHPLISVVDYGKIQRADHIGETNWLFDFYLMAVKRGVNARLKYGQQAYDFDEGILFFLAPNQVLRIEPEPIATQEPTGWMLLIHPDFLWNTPLAKTIQRYDFFDYSVNEALFLSPKEETTLFQIVQHTQHELCSNLDKFSKPIIIAQIETLLSYSERFYDRQFRTRERTNYQLLERLEAWLDEYFGRDDLVSEGLPTVQSIADALHTSPKYLSSVLRVLTGLNTQQHIHEKLIQKAKEKLSTTELSVGEIAYALGFEHSQSFSKLFKAKVRVSPLAFRQSFN